MRIAGRPIGGDHVPYVIAELSANHGGSLERALASVTAAHDAGADALKLQTYTPDTMTIDVDTSDFKISVGPWEGRTLYDLYREAHMPWEWHKPIFERARGLGLTVFSSVFDEDSVTFLEELGCPAYKIASFEIVDTPLIRAAAATGKPLIISTGMAKDDEIKAAVEAARSSGASEIALLHCTSAYPAAVAESNLLTIPRLLRKFQTVVGLSDHTMSDTAAIGAVVLGAAILEKHFTLNRDKPGPDTAFSATPEEFKHYAESCADAWHARGDANVERTPSETPNLLFRRSLYVIRDIKRGEVISEGNVRSIRPGFGLPPEAARDVIGRAAVRDLPRGKALTWQDVD
jgi:N-acetylneuraminate synthase